MFKNFTEFLKTVVKADTTGAIDSRLKKQADGTGLNEAFDSDGGFLVPDQFLPQLMARTYDQGAILNRAARIPVESSKIIMPVTDETSRADGSRFGGFEANWVEEGQAITATQPKIGAQTMKLQKLAALVNVTGELMDDADLLGPYLEEAFAREYAFKVEDMMVNGSGAGRAKGILQSGGLITIAKKTGQAANTILADNVLGMWYRCFAPSRKNAVWLINQDIEEQLSKMSISVGTSGVPIYQPATGPIVDGYPSLFGRPVIPVECCETLGTVGDIILADFSQYWVLEREMRKTVSLHVNFVVDEPAFRFVLMVNGQPSWDQVLTPKNGTNTVSPYVALATRN